MTSWRRIIPRLVALKATPEFEQSSDAREKVEMRFAHLKVHHRFERMRLRGLTGARDEFHLADIAQNLKTLANHHWRRPSSKPARVDDQRSTWIAVYGKSRTAGAD